MIRPGKWCYIFPLLMIVGSALLVSVPMSLFLKFPPLALATLIAGAGLGGSYWCAKKAIDMFNEIPKIIEDYEKFEREFDDD